jgi:sRNA-binding protein
VYDMDPATGKPKVDPKTGGPMYSGYGRMADGVLNDLGIVAAGKMTLAGLAIGPLALAAKYGKGQGLYEGAKGWIKDALTEDSLFATSMKSAAKIVGDLGGSDIIEAVNVGKSYKERQRLAEEQARLKAEEKAAQKKETEEARKFAQQQREQQGNKPPPPTVPPAPPLADTMQHMRDISARQSTNGNDMPVSTTAQDTVVPITPAKDAADKRTPSLQEAVAAKLNKFDATATTKPAFEDELEARRKLKS